MLPQWVTDCVMHRNFNTKAQPKVPFFLVPWETPATPSVKGQVADDTRGRSRGGSRAPGYFPSRGLIPSRRFTAPAQMRVSKVMLYVLNHELYSQHLKLQGSVGSDGVGEGGEGARSTEERVEIVCRERVVEPNLYLGAILQHMWNNAWGTMVLHYRSPQTP
ncbi:unnamed protein product [Discosporangium mesarthrocarpum]